MTPTEKAADEIRRYIERTGISFRELAKRAGVANGTIQRLDFRRIFEKGAPSLTFRTARKIEEAMRRFPPTNGA